MKRRRLAKKQCETSTIGVRSQQKTGKGGKKGGGEQTRPREGASPRSPLAELGTAPVMRRGQRRAAVWVGRGATARPREAEWSSRLAAVFWMYYNKNIFKDPNDYYDVTSGLYYI